MGEATREPYMGRATFDATETGVFTQDKTGPRHLWEVRCDWTAGSGGSTAVKTRSISGGSSDITVHTFAQAAGDASQIIETLCDDLVVTHTQGTASECAVEVIATALYPVAHSKRQAFSTVTPA